MYVYCIYTSLVSQSESLSEVPKSVKLGHQNANFYKIYTAFVSPRLVYIVQPKFSFVYLPKEVTSEKNKWDKRMSYKFCKNSHLGVPASPELPFFLIRYGFIILCCIESSSALSIEVRAVERDLMARGRGINRVENKRRRVER